jgi:RNA polymerase sigma-70 factor (family 1)
LGNSFDLTLVNTQTRHISLATLDETTLTTRVREGDERAFDEVFHRYYSHLLAIGVRYLKDPDLAEDAIQDVFLKLWQQREGLNSAHSLKAFLAVAMKNHVLNLIRNSHHTIWERFSEIVHDFQSDESLQESIDWQEYTTILEAGIRQLSPRKQEIFRLRVFEGLNNDQVAKQLAISVNTVKFQYTAASQFIRQYVSKNAQLEGLLTTLILLTMLG